MNKNRVWYKTSNTLPPEYHVVDTISEGGLQQELVLIGGRWFFPDQSVYVYYTVVFWSGIEAR